MQEAWSFREGCCQRLAGLDPGAECCVMLGATLVKLLRLQSLSDQLPCKRSCRRGHRPARKFSHGCSSSKHSSGSQGP